MRRSGAEIEVGPGLTQPGDESHANGVPDRQRAERKGPKSFCSLALRLALRGARPAACEVEMLTVGSAQPFRIA